MFKRKINQRGGVQCQYGESRWPDKALFTEVGLWVETQRNNDRAMRVSGRTFQVKQPVKAKVLSWEFARHA